MALSENRLQHVISNKDVDNAEWGESWSIIDGVMVIFDGEGKVPLWLNLALQNRDEDGNTNMPEVVRKDRQYAS